MEKLIFSLAIILPNGEETVIEVLDYAEIGSRKIEAQPQSQEQLLLFESPLSK